MPTDTDDTPVTRSQAQMSLDSVNGWLVANQNWQVTPQPNGQLQWGFPNAPPPPPTPVIATIPNFLNEHSGFSVDLAQYVTNPFLTATLIGIPAGWTLGGASGAVLSLPGATTTSQTAVQLSLTWSGGTVLSNSFQLSSIASPGPDVTPPTIPLKPTLVLNSLFQPVLSFNASNDPAPPSHLRSGMAGYPITRGSSVISTVAALMSGFNAALSPADLGTVTIAGSTTQNGSTLIMSGEGSDYFNTADSGQYASVPISGDFIASCQLLSATWPQTFSKIGIDCRQTLTAGSPHVAAFACLNTTAGGLQMNARSIAGGTTVNVANTTGTAYALPVWLMLQRAGDLFSMFYSADGITFNALGTITVALGATVNIGFVCASLKSGSSAAATLASTCISQDAAVSFTDTSISRTASPQNLTYAGNARDLAGNVSSGAPILSITVPATGSGPPVTGFGIKNTGGRLTTLAGVDAPLTIVSMVGTETPQGAGARFAGIGAITGPQWQAGCAKWATAGAPYAAPNCVRIPIVDAYWLGVSGNNPRSGGITNNDMYPGGKPGISAAAYQSIILSECTAVTAAGKYFMIDLHWTSLITSTGARYLPAGQGAAACTDALAFWSDVATKILAKFPNGMAEVYNEPFFSNASTTGAGAGFGWYQTYNGAALGPDTAAYVNANSSVWVPPSAGFQMQDNDAKSVLFTPSPGSSARIVGAQQLINAIAANCSNLIFVSLPGYAGGITMWLTAGFTDPRGSNQIGCAFHAYGQGSFTAAQAIQAAGFPVVVTEADGGNFPKTGFSYKALNAAAMGFPTGYASWNNYGAAANASGAFNTSPYSTLGMPTPNGSN